MRYLGEFICVLALGAMPMVGCSDVVTIGSGGTGGMAGSGGTSGTGGMAGSGGTGAAGGMAGTGGTAGSGGTSGTGGMAGSGGTGAAGGMAGTGGTAGSGGTGGTGGTAFPSEGLIAEYLMNAGDVSYDGSFYNTPDSSPDPNPPSNGRLFRWIDAVWNGMGDGGTWIATDRFGSARSAFYFSNTNASADEQYGAVRVTNLGSLGLFLDRSFSLALWVKENNGGDGWLVGQEGWANLVLSINSSGVTFTIPTPDPVTVTDTTPLVEDAWHFYVATVSYEPPPINSTTVRLYRDGDLLDNVLKNGAYTNPDSSMPLMIGDGSAEAQEFNAVKAYIDDVRVWNRALGAAEVRLLCELGGYICGAL